jgi:integrase
MENIREHFGNGTRLSCIRYADLETYRKHLREKLTKYGGIRKEASMNWEMACLRHLFSKAEQWEMVERSPFARGKSLTVKENNKRLRFLSEEEIGGLLEECPAHLKSVVVCGLNTGMRRSEILSLKWDQIRNGFIYLQKTKTNESRQIPINDDMAETLKAIWKEKQLKSEYVFTFGQRPVHEVKRSFAGAMKRAGIENFHFHDLRHTFASHLVMKGATIKDVQELLGHKDTKMTNRYAHLSREH